MSIGFGWMPTDDDPITITVFREIQTGVGGSGSLCSHELFEQFTSLEIQDGRGVPDEPFAAILTFPDGTVKWQVQPGSSIKDSGGNEVQPSETDENGKYYGGPDTNKNETPDWLEGKGYFVQKSNGDIKFIDPLIV